MDIVQEFKKDSEDKYKINSILLEKYQKARQEYLSVKSKYNNTLSELNLDLYKLKGKVQILKDEKVAFEKNLNFAAADEKQQEIEKIHKDINKISDRSKMIEDTLKNKSGEIKEKVDELKDILSDIYIDTNNKYANAFSDFNVRRKEYNLEVKNEILEILSPLGEIIRECRSLQYELMGYYI